AKVIDSRMVEQSRQTAVFTSKWKELLLGFSVVKSYGTEENARWEFNQGDEDMTRARVRTAVLTQIMMCSNLVMGWAMVVIPVVLSGYFVMKGDMEVGTIVTVFYIANRYCMPAMDVSAAWSNIKGSRGMREKMVLPNRAS
ncbi:MAG: ABC transporter transmembrane domain-containing protein, partial [Lachnospiraceae bacterium]